MQLKTLGRSPAWQAAVPSLLFLVLGLPFLRKTGVHYDAASELACFYSCAAPIYRMQIFGLDLPLMVLQYLGALKAWLYLPILKYLEVTPVSLRLPLLLAGALTVWLFFRLLDRVAGRIAALIGALLLATDLSFLISTAYDFGPIVLLHLFFVAGALLLLRFDETRRSRYLALAFFLFGLALWQKALFIWMLGGLGAGALAAFPRRVLGHISVARVSIAAGSLALGALPLLYYNIVTSGATLHTQNVMAGAAPLSQKLLLVKKTLDSDVLFGWMTEPAQPETAIAPVGGLGKLSAIVTGLDGHPAQNGMLVLLAAALCLLPWLWFTPARPAAVFAAIFLAVAWALMAALPNTGATIHHVILLWPMPHFLIAIAAAQLWKRLALTERRVLAAGLIAAVALNLAVINSFYTDLVTHGTSVIWTDAIYPLFAELDNRNASRVVTVDWGFAASLCLFSDGDMPLEDISFRLLNPTPPDATAIQSLMAQPEALFVDHAAGGEQFPGVRHRLEEIAAQGGYTKTIVSTIVDRNARPRFEIARYSRGLPKP